MSIFQATIDGAGDEPKLVFTGMIDEEAQLPLLEAFEGRVVHVDLHGVKAINSVGIRTWMNWVEALSAAGTTIVLERVPSALVLQFNMISGFLPKEAGVTSFYLPASCEHCGEDFQMLLSTDQVVSEGVRSITKDWLKKQLCKTQGGTPKECSLESDFNVSQYLAFVSRLQPKQSE